MFIGLEFIKLWDNQHRLSPSQGILKQKFLQARCPSCCLTHSVKGLKAKTLQHIDTIIESLDNIFKPFGILMLNERHLCEKCCLSGLH